MKKADLDGAALVHQAAFVRQQHSREWLQCNLSASPRFLNFVAESDGEIVGYTSSGAYGHWLGAAVGLGYVPCAGETAEDLMSSSYEIDVAGDRIAAKASLRPLYDPKSERIRG